MKNLTKSILPILFVFILFSCNSTSNKDTKENDTKTDTLSQQSEIGITELTEDHFETFIQSGTVLVDFYADWCKPCKIQAPIIEEVQKELAGKIKIGKINIDNHSSVANQFGIRSIPTLIIFKNGKPAKQLIGITSKEDIISAIETINK
ncbi:MAG TPA: thioredoxin [Bacteroidales bacterium]|nr:thioredoxin [Bacteroidales bacterium]HQI45536.1 thioredoxin [Bacteroidales bacterium]